MSLLQCCQTREGWYEVFCSNCLVAIGQLTVHEVRALSVAGITPLCFGCEGFECERISEHLRIDEPIYWLIIGDEQFVVNWEELAKQQGKRVIYYKGIVSGLYGQLSELWEQWGKTPLASSSNVHTFSEETDAIIKDFAQESEL